MVVCLSTTNCSVWLDFFVFVNNPMNKCIWILFHLPRLIITYCFLFRAKLLRNLFNFFIFLSVMNELLFECYQIPQVAFGIDSLFSLYYNQSNEGEVFLVVCNYRLSSFVWFFWASVRFAFFVTLWVNFSERKNALVISSGYQVSHILPVVNGKLDSKSCKRFVFTSVANWRESIDIFLAMHSGLHINDSVLIKFRDF